MTPVQTVEHIYGAFGRGDIPAILACLAADIDWEHDSFPNPVPWLQPLHGRDQVPRFFAALSQVDFHSFVPREILTNGDTVVSMVDLDCTVRSTGKRIVERDEIHLWRFNPQGLVQRFRHRADTWQQAMAVKGD